MVTIEQQIIRDDHNSSRVQSRVQSNSSRDSLRANLASVVEKDNIQGRNVLLKMLSAIAAIRKAIMERTGFLKLMR